MKKMQMVGMLLLALLTASCSSTFPEEDKVVSETKTATLSFSIESDDFQYSLTRAGTTAAEILKTLDLALYKQENGAYVKYKEVKSASSDLSFGKLTVENVAYGTYTVVALGNSSSFGGHAQMDNPLEVTYEGESVPVVYYVCQEVTVNDVNQSFNLELAPAVARFRIVMNGTVPAKVASMKVSIKNAYRTFNAVEGWASEGRKANWDVTFSDVTPIMGKAGQAIKVNVFLPSSDLSEGDGISIRVAAFGEDGGEIVGYDFNSVSLRKGYQTNYTGNFFQSDASFSVTINDEWGEINESY